MSVLNHRRSTASIHAGRSCCCYRYYCGAAATDMGKCPWSGQHNQGRHCWRVRGWMWVLLLLILPAHIIVQTILRHSPPAARMTTTTFLWRRWWWWSSPPKPFWIARYAGNDPGDLVAALVNRLTEKPGKNKNNNNAAAKGFNDSCVVTKRSINPGTVSCGTIHPMKNHFGGWTPNPPDYQRLFQSKVIMVLRNPAYSIPEYFNMLIMVLGNPEHSIPEYFHMRDMGVSNIAGWRANRDARLNPEAIVEWVSTLTAWKNLPEYDGIGLYLTYEDLLDPIQGPIATQKLARTLSNAGFSLVVNADNVTAMEHVWNQTVQERIRSQNLTLEFAADNYVLGYTADQKQTMVNILQDMRRRYANETDLVAVLSQYIISIQNIPQDAPETEPVANTGTTNSTILLGTEIPPSMEDSLQLRWDWTNLERHSPLAHRITRYQNNCSLPVANFAFNRNGLGSNLHVYGNALCKAMQLGVYRLRPVRPWLWLDLEQCATFEQNETNATNIAWRSALSCYFPEAEGVCPTTSQEGQPLIIVTQKSTLMRNCHGIENMYGGQQAVRAAMTEFLFTRVSPLVQLEAQRQLQLVFGAPTKDGKPSVVGPNNLITVHIRWGDKSAEMELVKMEHYIHAIYSLLTYEEAATTESNVVNIFLATEDPEALAEFRVAAPSHWTIYVDQYYTEMIPNRVPGYNGFMQMTWRLSGRPGLVALGSVLVAMQANRFVLTTGSNWSRLLNELRKNVLDPRCNNCTRIVDLLSNEW